MHIKSYFEPYYFHKITILLTIENFGKEIKAFLKLKSVLGDTFWHLQNNFSSHKNLRFLNYIIIISESQNISRDTTKNFLCKRLNITYLEWCLNNN